MSLENFICIYMVIWLNPSPISSTPRLPHLNTTFPMGKLSFLMYWICLLFLYVHGYRTIYWNTGNLSGAASLNKNGHPSTSSHKLSIVPQLGMELQEPSMIHAVIFAGFILCRFCSFSQCHREFMCAGALSQPSNSVYMQVSTTCFFSVFLSSSWIILEFREWVWCRYPS